ncbi:hypothetical protein ACJ5NV_04720 [Loktanella agnita]|uniref:hypothetical protein n=1 Tax=Loktanella agnita TaxID=287097 RepID=UPI00398839CA
MLSYTAETGWVFDPYMCALVVAVVVFHIYRGRVRRRSLHREADGTYVWIEWHGGERRSETDPAAPGGAWDSDGDGDGGD